VDDDTILNEVATRVVPMICAFGMYIIFNGHLSPGGGFAGGTVIGVAMILFSLVFGLRALFAMVPEQLLILMISLGPAWYALTGFVGLIRGANFLANGNAGIGLGSPGAMASSGIIPVITLGVGISVAITVTVLFVILTEAD